MKIKNYFFIAITAALGSLVNPLVKATDWSKSTTHNYPYCYLQQYSWLGLVLDEITYGPITVRDVHLNRGNQLVIVKPGETVDGQLRYRVDSTDQEISHRYHLVVGLSGVGAQECVTHAWESTIVAEKDILLLQLLKNLDCMKSALSVMKHQPAKKHTTHGIIR